MKTVVYATTLLLCLLAGCATPPPASTAQQVPVTAAANLPEAPCLVWGIHAYGHLLPGHALKTCPNVNAPDSEEERRVACPEMYAAVPNVSGAHCRAKNDRRNKKHDIPDSASAPTP